MGSGEGGPLLSGEAVLGCWGCPNEVPQTGWLQQQILSSHISGGWKSKIKVSTSLVSSKASVLVLYVATFSLWPHLAFLLSVSRFPPLIRTPVILD